MQTSVRLINTMPILYSLVDDQIRVMKGANEKGEVREYGCNFKFDIRFLNKKEYNSIMGNWRGAELGWMK